MLPLTLQGLHLCGMLALTCPLCLGSSCDILCCSKLWPEHTVWLMHGAASI